MKTRTHLLRGTLIAAGVLALSGGCAVSQTPAAQADDAVTHARVGSRLTLDPQVRRYEIDVDVLNDEVTLRGIVGEEEERAAAERVARNTPGVERVRNLIKLESEVDEAERSDIVMHVKIGSQLAADPDIRRTDIDVDVQEGVVTLSGVVADEEARAEALRIARSVEGVRDVRNEMKIARYEEALEEPSEQQQQQQDEPPAQG